MLCWFILCILSGMQLNVSSSIWKKIKNNACQTNLARACLTFLRYFLNHSDDNDIRMRQRQTGTERGEMYRSASAISIRIIS